MLSFANLYDKAIIDKWIERNLYLRQYSDAYGPTCLIHYDFNVPAEKVLRRSARFGCAVYHGDCCYIPHSFRISRMPGI